MPRWRRQRIKKTRKAYEQQTANDILALQRKVEAGPVTFFEAQLLERLQSPHFAHTFQRVSGEVKSKSRREQSAALATLVEMCS